MRGIFGLSVLACLLLVAAPAWAKKSATWDVPGDFDTIQEAIDDAAVADGDTIRVGAGEHFGALVDKRVVIKGEGNATITSGPLHPAGVNFGLRLNAGSSGSTISHLRFDNVDLAVFNGGAVDDVEVSHCTFFSAIQAISNWRGNGWEISHNKIYGLRTRNGGGIGILVADYSGGTVEDNVVSHNTILGTLAVWANDGGGYDGSGIVLYADFRWGGAGAESIQNNYVVKNKVSLVSDTPNVVDVVAFELTDTSLNPNLDVIFDNAIGFNDFRGTTKQIALTPGELDTVNKISRNLGNSRAEEPKLHPSNFKP
jgi:hypothetical protein